MIYVQPTIKINRRLVNLHHKHFTRRERGWRRRPQREMPNTFFGQVFPNWLLRLFTGDKK